MSVAITVEALRRIPSFEDFVRDVAEDAGEGRYFVVLTAGQVNPIHLAEALSGRLFASNRNLIRIAVSEQRTGESEPAFLSRTSCLEPAEFQPGRGGELDFVSDVILLEGLDEAPRDVARRWLKFIEDAARLRSSGRHSIGAIVRTTPDDSLAHSSDTRFSIHRWWEVCSVLDLRLLVRMSESGDASAARARWREAVLPPFAAGDVELVERLWDAVAGTEAEIGAVLREVAAERGIDPVRLKPMANALKNRGEYVAAGGPGRWEAAWRLGAAQATREFGPEPTVLALAVLEDMRELRHRLWRGQATLMLPQLDEVRMSVCEELSNVHGTGWPLRFARYDDEEDRKRVEGDPLATDYGPLERVVRNASARAGKFVPLVSHARKLRNELAHYRPITYAQYARFLELDLQLRRAVPAWGG